MKRFAILNWPSLMWFSLALIIALLFVVAANADHCRVRNNAVVIQSTGAVITPFAVPVATPVAVVSPYAYQHAGAASYGVQAQSADAKLFEEFLAWKKGRDANQVTAAVVPQTLLQQNCVKCHTSNADAKAHLDMSVEMTAEQKLAASRALLKGTMPKNKTIDDKTRGNLLGELLGVEEAK